MLSALLAFGAVLGVVGIILTLLGKSELALGFFAGATILPIQGLNNFRNAAYVAFGQNSRGAGMMLICVGINFVSTLILLPIIGRYVIIATPLLGYVVALSLDSRIAGFVKVPRARIAAGAKAFKELTLINKSLAINQILAFSLVTVESWVSYFFLNLRDAAALGLIANLTAAISVFPVTFSNQIQSQIVFEDSRSKLRVHGMLRASRIFLLESLSFVSLSGAIAMTILIQNFLSNYQFAILPLWIMALSTNIYGSTFYTSTYAIGIRAEHKVSKVQLAATLFVVITCMILVSVGWLTLTTLCLISAAKSLVYLYLSSRVMFLSSSKELVNPLHQTISTLLRSIPLIICLFGYLTGINLFIYIGLVSELILLGFRLQPTWKSLSRQLI